MPAINKSLQGEGERQRLARELFVDLMKKGVYSSYRALGDIHENSKARTGFITISGWL